MNKHETQVNPFIMKDIEERKKPTLDDSPSFTKGRLEDFD